MKTSENGINKIKSEEGLVLKAYKCQAGKATIGYGHTNGVQMGQKITPEKAEEFLREDLKGAERAVNKVNKEKGYNLNQNQFDSLVSFTFNTGVGHLKTLTQNRTKSQLTEGMKLYNKAGGKVSKGLKKRRNMEINLFNTPTKNSCNSNTTTKTNISHSNPSNTLSFIERTNSYTNQLNSINTHQNDFSPKIISRSNSYYGRQSNTGGAYFFPKKDGFSFGIICSIF